MNTLIDRFNPVYASHLQQATLHSDLAQTYSGTSVVNPVASTLPYGNA